ncbi:MAG: hypothetical protein M3119_06070 [Verrucomicrobiota bacterium]|nr:hypothetical protein [Verrucomicrobiota bacterium]MDQ6939707.1 hypothetical protein [Verrucomicrobiota bacterium]
MNIKNISEERRRIDGYKLQVGGARLFNERTYKEDLEWLTLAYMSEILRSHGRESPQYGQKIEGHNEPDFQTYITCDDPFRRIEVTEVLPTGYKRGAFFRELSARRTNSYLIGQRHPKPWSSFAQRLKAKIGKPYSRGSWLVIYHDVGYSEFQDGRLWHERTLSTLRTWTYDSDETCDITRSEYEIIFVVDSSGTVAIRLHPHWDVIKELRSEHATPL